MSKVIRRDRAAAKAAKKVRKDMLNRIIKRAKQEVKGFKYSLKVIAACWEELFKVVDGKPYMEIIGETELEGKEIALVESDMLTMAATMLMPHVPAGAVNKLPVNGEDAYVIFINKTARNLPKDELEGLIVHEFGHIVNGDLDNPLEMIKYNIKRRLKPGVIPPQEWAADEYAVEHGHGEGLIKVLRKINFAILDETGEPHKECITRSDMIYALLEEKKQPKGFLNKLFN